MRVPPSALRRAESARERRAFAPRSSVRAAEANHISAQKSSTFFNFFCRPSWARELKHALDVAEECRNLAVADLGVRRLPRRRDLVPVGLVESKHTAVLVY